MHLWAYVFLYAYSVITHTYHSDGSKVAFCSLPLIRRKLPEGWRSLWKSTRRSNGGKKPGRREMATAAAVALPARKPVNNRVT